MNKAFVYKLILRKAVGDSNKIYKIENSSFFKTICSKNNQKILHSLWDRMGVDSIAPFGEFYLGSNNNTSMWRKYPVNEKGLRSIFMNMERNKILYLLILQNMNITKLI